MRNLKGKIYPERGHFYLLKESVGQVIAWMDGGLEKMCGRDYFHCMLLALDSQSQSMKVKIKKEMIQRNRLRPIADIVQEIPAKEVEAIMAKAGLEVRKIFNGGDCRLAV